MCRRGYHAKGSKTGRQTEEDQIDAAGSGVIQAGQKNTGTNESDQSEGSHGETVRQGSLSDPVVGGGMAGQEDIKRR